MIISKTPLRMSFVGGGSDMPSFYKEHGGAVLSSAIDAFVYIAVKKKRPGVHAKTKTSRSKNATNYIKPYRGQGR